MRYPADPPTVDEIVAVMRETPDDRHGWRVRAMIVVLWRAGLRIQEALALPEHDLDHRRGSILVRSGKGGRRREVGMDEWGWEQLHPWLTARTELPIGPLFCIIDGPTCGRPWSGAAVRSEFRRPAAGASVRRRFAPHQLRHDLDLGGLERRVGQDLAEPVSRHLGSRSPGAGSHRRGRRNAICDSYTRRVSRSGLRQIRSRSGARGRSVTVALTLKELPHARL
jgi:integrase